jgi:hypothetical protein
VESELTESRGRSSRKKRQITPNVYKDQELGEEKKFLKKKRKIMKIKRGSNVLWTEEEVGFLIYF